jgi:HK97 family phage portal protein
MAAPAWLSRLFSRQPEQRAGVPFYGPVTGPALAGVRVNTAVAENLSTVTACVGAIASGLASLPAYVYRSDGAGRVEAPQHPVARLIRQPNPRQTWPDFLEWLVASTLLNGNGIAAIDMDGAGRPTNLWPIPWSAVQPVLLPSNQLAFDVMAYTTAWGGTGLPRRYLASEVLHLKDRSDDGWLGRSRISRAPDVLASAIGAQTFSTALWNNAATPSGVLELPAKITPDGFRRQREFFEQTYSGAANARRVLFADAGSKWTSISVSPEDAEVLASRQFSVTEIARLFGVPPPIVQDYSNNTFTNAATAALWFAQFSLAPWARKIEAEFQRQVFGDAVAYSMEIDLSGLTRGDYSTRWTANVAAVGAGILTVDEIREQEGYGPLPEVKDPPVPGDGGK